MPLFFRNYFPAEVADLLIRLNKTKFFLEYIQNADRNGVNQQNTHSETNTHKKRNKKEWVRKDKN